MATTNKIFRLHGDFDFDSWPMSRAVRHAFDKHMRKKPRTRKVEKHRRRILLTIAAREKNNNAAPGVDWFSEAALHTVRELIHDGLVENKNGIRLTAAGWRFIDGPGRKRKR